MIRLYPVLSYRNGSDAPSAPGPMRGTPPESPPRFALQSHKLDSCDFIGRASGILAALLDVVNGGKLAHKYPDLCTEYLPVFTAVRIHAINHRNWYWTTVVLVLGICAIPKNIVNATH